MNTGIERRNCASCLGRTVLFAIAVPMLLAVPVSCGGDSRTDAAGTTDTINHGSGGNSVVGGPAPAVTSECGSLRMTQYASSSRRWCGFDRTSPILPEFVRAGMTVAIAEPYSGSSYSGDPGEACGECWEIDTLVATQVVMVHDLCPIEGNPICAGSHFHFDVSTETAAVLSGSGPLGAATVRRVPCPVTGNIHAYISDRNQYGYLKVAFFNHRFPIRRVEYRPVGGTAWLPAQRCLARWCVEDDNNTFAADGPGGVFRMTSAPAEIQESTTVLTHAQAAGSVFDTGVQFASVVPAGAVCEFLPPANVYDEQWGGIEGVRWSTNTWGSVQVTEVSTDCADASASCVLISGMQDGGVHLVYRVSFPATTFSRLSLQVRAQSGGGTVEVAPRSEQGRCTPTTVVLSEQWTPVDIDIAASCAAYGMLQGLTISRSSGALDLVVDEIRFQ